MKQTYEQMARHSGYEIGRADYPILPVTQFTVKQQSKIRDVAGHPRRATAATPVASAKTP